MLTALSLATVRHLLHTISIIALSLLFQAVSISISRLTTPPPTPVYSQCIPGTDPNSQALPTPTSSGSGGGGAAPTGGPGSTLQNGYLWIRAVAAPNFHKYLQTKPQYVPGTAIMDSYTTAGQFQIVDGQLEQRTFSSSISSPPARFSVFSISHIKYVYE